MLDREIILNLEKKIIVNNDPFPHAAIENFLPAEIVKKAEEEFLLLKKTNDSGNMKFQKTKRHLESYKDMPTTIKKIIDFFYSTDFMNLLERKFNLKNVQADWDLHGGGLHESFKGGFLKIHSDFFVTIYHKELNIRT